MTKGRIFSIEEFSTYDGAGIRMTVFLKGCPMRCTWCHNPEGQSAEIQIVRRSHGCLSCGACLMCGEHLTGKSCLVPESIFACPRGLVRLCGEDITPETLAGKIEKNITILNMSGGGVTFSGGEPLQQADFVISVTRLLRGKTNVALQTSGYAPTEVFERVIAACDFVLYDLKLMDGTLHQTYTGVDNATILENYSRLVKSGVKFCTRLPLIPGVSDTEANIRATASFLKKHGVGDIELLPYNKMAGGKYGMLGREYRPAFDTERNPRFREEIFHQYGIEVKIL